ncbi:hypothetical protein F0310_03730 [Borrelia sp. A-FGy1]|uniref:hypothetical protein n=1 Tax=Borrelia sp. A-FGy1 TaxID=2608247 RepID=UPI0015F3CA05|nr:hypothetical protein [Borrelia sp. A-FGy1]QMU99496.1 hypothetical protein F0310_03730 [Borrelia sp. A-FGy1]
MFFITAVLLLFLTFFYFISKFINQIDFDLAYLTDNIRAYNVKFFKDLDLEQYFDKTLGEHDLVSSYYLLSSVNGILVYRTKDNFIYKFSDKLDPVLLKKSIFIKKFKVNFELGNDLISLVVYYNILPKNRILYILNFYLFLMSLLYLHFSIFILYCIYRNTSVHVLRDDVGDGDHASHLDDLH